MVRKIICLSVALLLLLSPLCGAAGAESYSAYEGTISSTYLTYFKDIVPNIPFTYHYVAFRSGQYEYTMIVGEIYFNNGLFSADDTCTVYSFTSSNSYNSYYSYNVSTISDFSLNAEDKIIYSDIGNYPQLEERGQKYEILTTVLLLIVCLCVVVGRIFSHR